MRRTSAGRKPPVRGEQEFAASFLDPPFASLEDLGEQTQGEARLAALKSMDRKAIDY
ncbi:hypothetical protein [Pseudarthrobacter niigatensis]|uniref:Uncharacterized protein n=1 Tax=Pseudarthrobacter niigatensis TaxID=369935 RepID=A0AAJ1SPM5_9MICC|nr:hypothetical protein [Pseudarthrobacter niigatensis]MDQ0144746.1 hypothetical protein [Pseudarthrobacter niigatensis]MDQ0265393.1 hypothetical protein [Pseudarthrobacter niigatensis]